MFQGVVKELPGAPAQCLRFFELGQTHRAWTLLTDRSGKAFADFDAFCACEQPWGLGMDPEKFRAHLEAEVGKRAAELATVAPGQQGERNDTSGHCVRKSEQEMRKVGRLRAILRAPEVVQQLYKENLITQTTAAKMGPKSPPPALASAVAEARQEMERLDRSLPKKEFRKEAERVVSSHLGGGPPTKKVKPYNVNDDINKISDLLDSLRENWTDPVDQQAIRQFLRQCANEV
jgi:hypothetical protein